MIDISSVRVGSIVALVHVRVGAITLVLVHIDVVTFIVGAPRVSEPSSLPSRAEKVLENGYVAFFSRLEASHGSSALVGTDYIGHFLRKSFRLS